MTVNRKNAIDPNAVVKERDHRFLFTGIIPPSLWHPHKKPAIIPEKAILISISAPVNLS